MSYSIFQYYEGCGIGNAAWIGGKIAM